MYIICKKKNKKRKHHCWAHKILKKRKVQGAYIYQHLVTELQEKEREIPTGLASWMSLLVLPPEFQEKPNRWCHFRDFPIQIRIRMPHQLLCEAIHFFALHNATCGSELINGHKNSRSYEYFMSDFLRHTHMLHATFHIKGGFMDNGVPV